MKLFPVAAGALASLLLLTSTACADPIPWTFAWSRSPNDLAADAPGTGHIQLTADGPTRAVGDSDVVATNLYTHSTATSPGKDAFTAKAYTLTLTLTDLPSGASTTLTFSGKLDGWITAESSHLRNTFTGTTAYEVKLGSNQYTVTIGPYTPPSVPQARNAGSIGAQVTVVDSGIVQQLPEPGTLVLAGLGVSLFLASRKRRAGE